MKANICDVLYQKLLLFELHVASTPVSTRPVAHEIILYEDCVQKKPRDKK